MSSLPVTLVDFREDIKTQIRELEAWFSDPKAGGLKFPSDADLAKQVEELKALIGSREREAHTESSSLLIKRLLNLSTTELSRLVELRSQTPKPAPGETLDLLNQIGQLKLVSLRLESCVYEQETGLLGKPVAANNASQPRWLQVGQMLAGRYKIEAVVGRGGTGAVYKVADTRTPQCWAVKELWSDNANAEHLGLKRQLMAEITMLSQLRHSNLPRIVDAFESDGRHYIVMDFIHGRDLRNIVREAGPLSLSLVVSFGTQIASVLDYLHCQPQPIIFRDLKPANIMVDVNGKIKLIDFGIARLFMPEATSDTRAFGTPGYAAPEQYGRGQSDKRTDVYTLGATLHELLTARDPGETPFRFPPVRSLRPEVPVALENLIAKCLALNPDDRYSSLKEVLSDLSNALTPVESETTEATEAPPEKPREPIIAIMRPAAPKPGFFSSLLNTMRTRILRPGTADSES